MTIKEQNNSKSVWIFTSICLHLALIASLGISLSEKPLYQLLNKQKQELPSDQPQTTAQQQASQAPQKANPPAQKVPAAEKKVSAETFVVPAPVIFYGNQTELKLPTPVDGDPQGKSSYSNNPSALSVPSAHPSTPRPLSGPLTTEPLQPTIVDPTIDTPDEEELHDSFTKEKNITPEPTQEIMESIQKQSQSIVFTSNTQPTLPAPAKTAEREIALDIKKSEKKSSSSEKKAAKKLTLADLFKNTHTETTYTADSTPEVSATKAGTKGGDRNGSGQQLTIKEGDMKYYSLWAKFLNHLNQAARFNRRGREKDIHNWIVTEKIRYVIQCGITVDAKGNVLDIDLTHSSGHLPFDELCISDIYSAIPFPPLPETLGKKTARFEVNVYP